MSRGHGSAELRLLAAVKGHYQGVCISDIGKSEAERASLRRAAYKLEDEGKILLDLRMTSALASRRPKLHAFPIGSVIIPSPDNSDPYWYEWGIDKEEEVMRIAHAYGKTRNMTADFFAESCKQYSLTHNQHIEGSPNFYSAVINWMETGSTSI
ncbi:hypothetical protein WM016_04795 [Bifidobacterium mongoliense]|uniref:hypothetical protein n=1 Tax=Bifidobacterium mongoliense TaxID=518643 RepID=UPI0030EEE2F9